MAPSSKLDLSQRDASRQYEPADNERLARNLAAILAAVRSGAYADRPVDTKLLCELHGRLFSDVRDHAGNIATGGSGPST